MRSPIPSWAAAAAAALLLGPLPLCLAKPNVPLFSKSRWIVDSDDDRVKLRCINWAGHMEVNIPEGLDKQPVDHIADWIADEGFNCVRLTFATDLTLKPALKVKDSFRQAAEDAGVSETKMMALYEAAEEKNPFLKSASILDVFDVIVEALWERDVMTILDNHVSKASWCCMVDDGNGWWKDAPIYWADNSRYFDTDEWLAGLQTMAVWSQSRPGVVGLSLRNELRATWTQFLFAARTWYDKVHEAARLVHEANEDLLVVIGGLNSATDFTPMRERALDTSSWADKNVWEAHMYDFSLTTPNFGNCDVEKAQLGLLFGFVLEQGKRTTGPLFLSEFGVRMTGGPVEGLSEEHFEYLSCLVDYMETNDADWALWAVQGSYYVREGIVNWDEGWGAMDFQWKGWRNPKFKAILGRMWDVTQGP